MLRSPRYTVVYRTGGTLNAKWHRTNVNEADKAVAEQKRFEVEAMGYKALVFTVAALDAIGLPEGHEYAPAPEQRLLDAVAGRMLAAEPAKERFRV